jgi:hypothetical protein
LIPCAPVEEIFFFHHGFPLILAHVEPLTSEEIRRAVRAALDEDIGRGDVTTLATVPEAARSSAAMRARDRSSLPDRNSRRLRSLSFIR